MKKPVKDKRPHGRHGQPDEPRPKDSGHDEDDVVNAIAPNEHYYRPIQGDLDEAVTGIGGRDVSADDPGLLDDEAAGHLGLDEKEGKGLYHNVNKRRRQGKAPKRPGDKGYPTDKAWKDSAKTAKESIEEGWRIQFAAKPGIVYSGVVIGQSRRYLFVEMSGDKLNVRKDEPSIKVLEKEKPTYGIPYPCPSASCPDEDKAAKRARRRLKKKAQ